jgi:DNA-binding PadR family transcriptional regulator
VLESAGLITIEKGHAGKRARTWVTLTKAGQAARADEIAQLKLLISRIDRAGTPPG